MTLTNSFDAANSRVILSATAQPQIPNLSILLERQTPTTNWLGVRGGYPATPIGGTFTVDDYEFTPNVLNSYRIRTDFVYDTFTRVLANSWGNADSGQTWTYTASGGSTINNWDIPSGQGVYTMADTVATSQPGMRLNGMTQIADFDIYADVSLSQLPTGGNVAQIFRARSGGTSLTFLQMFYTTVGTMSLVILGNNGVTSLATAAMGFAAGTVYHVRFQGIGLSLRAKVWTGDPILDEPTTWTLAGTDTVPSVKGIVGVEAIRLTGNTNVNNLMTWDNFHIADLATTNTNYGSLGTTSVTPSQNTVWLKFPLRPFLNRQITLCNWEDEDRPARGAVFDVLGRSAPVAVTEVRGSRRFPALVKAVDSNEIDLLNLSLSFGETIFLQTPDASVICLLNRRSYPQQGYFYVEDTTSSRPLDGVATWMLTLPLIEVSAPDVSAGGANSTWGGIIAAYATWQDVINAFATWADVLNFISNPLDEIVG